MRPSYFILASAMLLLTGGVSMAQWDTRPKNLRVCVQFIEMPHPVLTELLAGKAESGDVVHAKAMALTKEGKAKLLESSMIMTRSGQKSMIETIHEAMYLTDFSNLPHHSNYVPSLKPIPPDSVPVVPNLYSFETRNVGVTLEVEATLVESDNLVDLWLIPEVANLQRFRMIQKYVDESGFDSIQMPVIETCKTKTSVTLMNGKFELAASITPKPADLVPTTLRKILVFVRCDVLPVEK